MFLRMHLCGTSNFAQNVRGGRQQQSYFKQNVVICPLPIQDDLEQFNLNRLLLSHMSG